jgi:hypothetical protein
MDMIRDAANAFRKDFILLRNSTDDGTETQRHWHPAAVGNYGWQPESFLPESTIAAAIPVCKVRPFTPRTGGLILTPPESIRL